MGNHQFPPSEVEIRLENGNKTANTLGFFLDFFFGFYELFFPEAYVADIIIHVASLRPSALSLSIC